MSRLILALLQHRNKGVSECGCQHGWRRFSFHFSIRRSSYQGAISLRLYRDSPTPANVFQFYLIASSYLSLPKESQPCLNRISCPFKISII